jgi:hypothetical protein
MSICFFFFLLSFKLSFQLQTTLEGVHRLKSCKQNMHTIGTYFECFLMTFHGIKILTLSSKQSGEIMALSHSNDGNSHAEKKTLN